MDGFEERRRTAAILCKPEQSKQATQNIAKQNPKKNIRKLPRKQITTIIFENTSIQHKPKETNGLFEVQVRDTKTKRQNTKIISYLTK